MKTISLFFLFIFGITIGFLVACSPTKFNNTNSGVNNICSADVSSCVVQNGYLDITQNFQVGSGKVDILFIIDNSASMSIIQKYLSEKFDGFLYLLDNKKTDYRIALTTTDLVSVRNNRLVSFLNGSKFLTNKTTNRSNLFNGAIIREETRKCEDFILGMYNSFGPTFQNQIAYSNQYNSNCPSSDTRGIYSADLVLSENSNEFIRSDANLNIIVVSNDDVRQGKIALENKDSSEGFNSMMNDTFPNKYWDFNSIIVKDSVCLEKQVLKTIDNKIVINESGESVVKGGYGYEYAKISNSAAKDIDNNPRPRGKILDICESSYTKHFNEMATQITDSARMITLKCIPHGSVTISYKSGAEVSSTLYKLNSDKITFLKGTEGQDVSIQYKCYTGPK